MYQAESITSQVRSRLQSFINDNTAPWYAFFCCACDGDDASVTIAGRLVAFIDGLSPSPKLPRASSQRLLSTSSLSVNSPLLSLEPIDMDNIIRALLEASAAIIIPSTGHLTIKQSALRTVFIEFLPSSTGISAVPSYLTTALDNYIRSGTKEAATELQRQLQTYNTESTVGFKGAVGSISSPLNILSSREPSSEGLAQSYIPT